MIGDRVGPYRVLSELGAGGMGTVFLAEVEGRAPGIDTGGRVALKIVHHHLLEQPGFFKRFMREADIGKTVDDDNVVRTLDVDAIVSGGTSYHFLVMEFVEGQTLRALLQELGRVPEELCRHIGREVASALAAIHGAGVVHRDLKPDNVLITGDEQIKVMDLGVARLADEAIRLSQTGSFVGSVLYAAPEQFTGASGTDGRADLYALGLTLYELAAGQHPFADGDLRVAMRKQLHEDPRSISEINPQLTPFYEELVKTLLQKSADERFATAVDVVAVLDQGEDSEWWKKRAQEIRVVTKQPLRRVRVARDTALYGRDTELGKLASLFERVRRGDGQVVIVEGEAGIGRTRLVDEFVGQLRQQGEDLNFLFGAYPPGGAATAAGAFSTAYREHFGSEGLETALRDYLTETPVLIPSFSALLLGDSTPKGEEPLTRDSIQTVFVHATRALAAERPTIVLIDDLQFAPEEGRALFAALSQATADHRVMLIATARPGLPGDWLADVERQEHASHIALARLGAKDLAKMLRDAFRSERLAQELAYEIAAKSDGNPYFVFEIIRGLREGSYITQQPDGTWTKSRAIRDIQIPSSVLDLIQARIVDLVEDEKDLLDVAACAGFEFDAGLIGEALGVGRIPTLKRFARLESKHRLVRCVGEHFVFDHHQVQEALYNALPPPLAREYHAALAETLERREGAAQLEPENIPGKLALALCEQFLKGGQGRKALRYLDRALTYLSDGYLKEAAVALADRALGVTGLLTGRARLDVLIGNATRLGTLGRPDQQRAAIDGALELAEEDGSPGARGRALYQLGAHLTRSGGGEAATQALSTALELATEADDPALQVSVLRHLGGAAWHRGRFDQAREYWQREIDVARESGDRAAQSTGSGSLAVVLWDLGRVGEARDLLEEQVRVSGVAPTPLLNLGELCGILGALERARDLLERARARGHETGYRQGEAQALHELGDLRERAGDRETAESMYREALVLNRDIRNPYETAEVLVLLGRLCLSGDRPDEARTHLDEAIRVSREIGRKDSEVLAAAYLALLPGGDAAQAESLCGANHTHMGPFEAIEARFVLWRVTGKREHLGEAHRLLVMLRENAPEDCRDTMIENVPLHRDVWAAAQEAGL